jgi:hypothetical protein
MTARLIQVIETDEATKGCGITDCRISITGHVCEPIRRVRRYYATDGALLAEVDTWASDWLNNPTPSSLESKP